MERMLIKEARNVICRYIYVDGTERMKFVCE